MLLLAFAVPVQGASTTRDEANSYDDEWQNEWVAHCRGVYRSADQGKTEGFVLMVGDSITYHGKGAWSSEGEGRTREDLAIVKWMHADRDGPRDRYDVTVKNGFYLASINHVGWPVVKRGLTACASITSGGMLSGYGKMGRAENKEDALKLVQDTCIAQSLQIDTVATAFGDAQFAVLMLGTNDSGFLPTPVFSKRLELVIDALEKRNIVVVLVTIPPRIDKIDRVKNEYVPAIRRIARRRKLPLIDYYQEIVKRREHDWNGTLLNRGGIHPSSRSGGFTTRSSPYAHGGDPSTYTTGAACTHSGLLLREWLIVQKMKEVKVLVVDGKGAPGPAGR